MDAKDRVKQELKNKQVKQWQLADALGMREESLSRLFRYQLPTEQAKKMISVIYELAERKQHETWIEK